MFEVLFLALLVLTLPAAHIIGALVARASNVKEGHIREAMPSLPASPPFKGRAERRWEKRITKVERDLIARFENGATGVEAHELAAQIGEEPLVVDAVLTRLREEIPCRMRIMQSGKIYHDFDAKDIAELKSKRRKSWPRQVLLTGLAAMANIGAAWPVISVAVIAIAALYEMGTVPQEETLTVGIAGLIAASGLILVTFIAGFVAQLLFTPLRGPKIADVIEGEKRPKRTTSSDIRDDLIFWTWVDASPSPLNSFAGSSYYSSSSSSSSSSWFGGGSSGSSGGDWDLDLGDADEGILIVIVVILLLAILAAALSVFWIWLRGIWRALRRLEEPQKSTSPTLWVRTADIIDKWERYIPTNDLVVRTLRSLRRYFEHRRPVDDDLAARVLVLARSKGGVVSTLDLMLQEGLDSNEASEVGTRLAGMLGGKIMVSDDGELAFAFPTRLLETVVSTPDDDMWAEYIVFDKNGNAQRRNNQRGNSVPVNIVGLTKGHLLANDRLVAGTYIMALMGFFLTAFLFTGNALGIALGVVLSGVILAMALGTATLNATARYTAREAAAQGIRRDIRRATFKKIKLALEKNQSVVILEGLSRSLYELFRPAWRGLDVEEIDAEIRGVVIDLELEPSMDERYAGQDVYELNDLRRRLNGTESLKAIFEDEEVAFDFSIEPEEDEVIYDTQIQHDKVTVLGRA